MTHPAAGDNKLSLIFYDAAMNVEREELRRGVSWECTVQITVQNTTFYFVEEVYFLVFSLMLLGL